MELFIISPDQAGGPVPDAYFAYARARVAAWVADPSHGTLRQWPALLDIVADMVGYADRHQPFTDKDLDRVAVLDDETMATACAWAAVVIQLTGGNSLTVSQQYMKGDLPVAGACIITFIGGKPRSPLANHTLARLIGTLDTDERANIAANIAACMCVLRFTPEEVRTLVYPTDADVSADRSTSTKDGCDCAMCEDARAHAVTDPQT